MDKTSIEIAEGDEVTLVASVNHKNATNKNITWSSSDIAVVTVLNGEIAALSAGHATIYVTTEDGGHTAACEVNVKANISG